MQFFSGRRASTGRAPKKRSVTARIIAGAAALTAAFAAASGTCVAQDRNEADEPRLDPIFGKRPPPSEEPVFTGPMNDDEFDQPQGWSPLRGFVGVLNYLVPETADLSVGVGPAYQPDYFGSDDFVVVADPQVYVKVRNFLFLDDDGADLALFGFSGFAFGPSIRLAGRRLERFNEEALEGLGDIGFTFEAGGFVATTFLDRILMRAKIRKGVAGGHDGLIIDAAGTVLMFKTKRFSASFSGQTTWIDDSFADTYFSVTPEQSAASGLPVYDAGAGFRDVGGSFNGYINVGKRWSVNPYVRYRRIFRDIADTPIISQFGTRNQFVFGFHVMRQFNFDFLD